MLPKLSLENERLFIIIKVISNRLRFRILELTQSNYLSISQLSSALNLSYTKCSDYVRLLNSKNLVKKVKRGKEVRVRSKVIFKSDRIIIPI